MHMPSLQFCFEMCSNAGSIVLESNFEQPLALVFETTPKKHLTVAKTVLVIIIMQLHFASLQFLSSLLKVPRFDLANVCH